MEQRSVSHQELKELLLDGKHLVIALVDKDLHSLGLPLWSSLRLRARNIGFKGPALAQLAHLNPLRFPKDVTLSSVRTFLYY